MVLSCNYLTDLVATPELSTAEVRVVVLDTCGLAPGIVAGAQVEAAGVEETTDAFGLAVLSGVTTDPSRRVRVTHPLYEAANLNVDLTLSGTEDSVWLQRRPVPPVVELFSASPVVTRAIDDTVTFTVVVSSAFPREGLSLWFGDEGIVSLLHDQPPPDTLRFRHVYDSAGPFDATLKAYNDSGDTTSAGPLRVTNSSNRRPQVRTQIDLPGFLHGQYGQIKVTVDDPDSNFAIYRLNWGDGRSESNTEPGTETYLHRYFIDTTTASDSTFVLTVVAEDRDGAVTVYAENIYVRALPPLLLSNQVEFTPSPYLSRATDSVVTIGVHVLSTIGYIRYVTWEVNPGTEYARSNTRVFDSSSGNVGPGGADFEFPLQLAGLPDTNFVRIVVENSYGQTTIPNDHFYISD